MSWKCLFASVFLLILLHCGAAHAQYPMLLGSGGADTTEEITLPEDASPEQIADFLSGLSDEQVRQVFLASLKKDAEENAAVQEAWSVQEFIHVACDTLLMIRDRIEYVCSGARHMPVVFPTLLGQTDSDKGGSPLGRLLGRLAVLAVVWFSTHWFLMRGSARIRRDIDTTPKDAGWSYKAGRLGLRLLIDFAIMGAVVAVLSVTYLVFFHEPESERALLIICIGAVLVHELARMTARFLLAPEAPGLRLLPLTDSAASRMFFYAEILGCELALGLIVLGVVQLHGSTEALYLMVISLFGLVLGLTVCIMALANATSGGEALRKAFPPGTLRHRLAKSWHWLTVAYILLFWAFWAVHLLAFGYGAMISGALTLLAVPTYLGLSWVVDRTVIFAGELARPALLEEGQEPAGPDSDFLVDEQGHHVVTECPVVRLRRFLHKMFSVILLAAMILMVFMVWGADMPLARRVVGGALSVLVTLVSAYILWAISKAAIEKKLRSQQRDDDENDEGGSGGDRLSTLLELLQRFIFAVLIVMVVLIVLSSLGVDTAPLLAGAGVFGIAIGFGSQTLVKDIISGVFFLMDDAFRVGDYIQVGTSKGTVEEISVRSMKLRHHLGMLYTIPYGSVREVRNMTRDWSMMKLEYLVPFDTDIQQVKKIVKQINKEIKAIPELSGGMLTDIKSQGVKAMEEYGMRMRIKFMTKPGSQFTIRKLILAKLRKKFEEQGLSFAYRKVSVALPDEVKADAEKIQQVGAAVAQAVEEEEQTDRKQGDDR